MHATTVARKHFDSSYLLPFRQRRFFEQEVANSGADQPNFGMPASTPWPKLAAAMTTFEPVAMSLRALSPPAIRPPFARYSHGIVVPAGHRLVFTSGQLGIAGDETVPADSEAQSDLCFANIAAILAEDRMTLANIVRLNAYVTAREHMQGYMRSRDRQFPGTPPSSTLMIVSGFSRPEFLVEIEAVAAAPDPS
jgi:2-iminobutanoate/2-iminopropanoate deaminase